MSGAGRYAPSPTGDLHLGNLRTAMLAWLFARSTGRAFLMRVDDLDPDRSRDPRGQLSDLAALGITHDGPVVLQSANGPRHLEVLASLEQRGLVYECFCTRREIQEAASAPHGEPVPDGAYPGTCRTLDDAERAVRRKRRPAALRLRADESRWTVRDLMHGEVAGAVDDLVLRRGDGTIAYNLAVVVDDHDEGIDQVVRGDDLLASAPRHAYLASLLGWEAPTYAHVPLALNHRGQRLAKRDGAVTMAELGWSPGRVRGVLGSSLGLCEPREEPTMQELLTRFDPARLPREPWIVDPAHLG